MVDSNVTTITLDGNEIKVEFGSDYPYYQITNKGDTDIYVSMSPNITPETDGVYTVSAGGSEIIGDGYPFGAFYLLGTGKVYIRGKRDAMSASFKLREKGGDESGGGLKTKIVTELPEIGSSEYLYLVPKDDSLSDNIYNEYLWVDGKWELIGDTAVEVDLTDYAKKEDIPTVPRAVADFTMEEWYTSTSDRLFVGCRKNWTTGSYSVEESFLTLTPATTVRAGVMTAADKTKLDSLPIDLSNHTDNKNNPHEVKPEQIKKTAIIIYDGKTVAEFKEALLNWWSLSKGTLTTYRFSGGDVNWWLMNFENNDAIIPSGQNYQLTPIVDYSPNKGYATFLFSTVINNGASSSILKLELWNNQFVSLNKLVPMTGVKGESETEYRTGDVNISQSDIGLVFDGLVLRNKTVGEAKEIIINTYLSNSNKFGIFMFVPSDLINEWNTNDHILTAGSVCQITPVGCVVNASDQLSGCFLIGKYNASNGEVWQFNVNGNVVSQLNRLLTSNDITPEMLEKLKNL